MNSDAQARGPGSQQARRRAILLLALGGAIAVAVAGATLVGLSPEPNTDYLEAEPWLLDLGAGRLGVEFLTYGRAASAVRFGVVDRDGTWVSGPGTITPSYGYGVYPARAYSVADAQHRAHVVWNLLDSIEYLESFHYIQLDSAGRVRAVAGPLGTAPVLRDNAAVYPQVPGITLTADEVQVYWRDRGNGTKAVLDMNGQVLVPATPTAPTDNATSPPSRQSMSGSSFDGGASVVQDSSGALYYLWVHGFYGGSPRYPVPEYALTFRRTGAGGPVEKVLYSTLDTWWLSKPLVLPGLVVLSAGAVAASVLAIRASRAQRQKSRR